ncbi:uncharacterized protein EDB93DRAFT_1308749 [Suillus bovinus]|uniref:uncharacterized protein n=1 Tax=Suillus bovinus TaxID=48563 RepID=UPI001B87C47B|nr:uncharacterized protein EDB93DRAFT_1308749 [Suillus bovinus]KAG2133221.1 hypothetical protein EDB93DRAFT_1308749 [Suillus bovinus]
MSSNDDSVAVTAIWTDDRNTIQNSLRGSGNTVAMAVGILQNHISKHVSEVYGLEPPLDPLAMKAKYYPDVKPSDMLSVCRSGGFTALFTPNAETNHHIKTQLAKNAPANQTSVEPSTTLATDTATTQSSTSAVPPRKSKKAKKRNAALTANTASTANPPQVTMDNQLKEMLASMQKEMTEMRGKNESMHSKIERMHSKLDRVLGENKRILGKNKRILSENESMPAEIERINNENESLHDNNEHINNDLASVRKDLDAARVKHTQDVETLREESSGHHRGQETWEGLRSKSSVYELSDTIFDGLKQKGNIAAHSAMEEDIRHAVLTQQLEFQERACLETLFTYAYDGTQL